jgi:hypothetical protein
MSERADNSEAEHTRRVIEANVQNGREPKLSDPHQSKVDRFVSFRFVTLMSLALLGKLWRGAR